MATIPLYRGGEIVARAQVSEADEAWLSRWRWRPGTNGYAVCQIWLDGKPRNKKMHRAVMLGPEYMCSQNTGRICVNEVDHANGDRIDNRRENLRFANRAENQWNAKRKPGHNPFKGVYAHRRGRNRDGAARYEARIRVNGLALALGRYDSAEDAAAVVAEARAKYHGEFARVG